MMNFLQEFLVVSFVVLSIYNKDVSGDALSSQDEHNSLMEYQPLLQLVRNGRQNIMFNRHPAIPVHHEDDYGRSNQIASPRALLLPQDVCPKINPLPAHECQRRRAGKTCWSVGQPDVDCPSPDGSGYAVCCFDGCSNSCQYKTPSVGTKQTLRVSHKVSRPPGVPAPAPLRAPPTEPTLVATTEVQAAKTLPSTDSHHSQEYASGAYHYGYNDGLSKKEESRTPDGAVHGSYSYLDPNGRLVTNNYVADAAGFRSSLSTSQGEPVASGLIHKETPAKINKPSFAPKSRTQSRFQEEMKKVVAETSGQGNHNGGYYTTANHGNQIPPTNINVRPVPHAHFQSATNVHEKDSYDDGYFSNALRSHAPQVAPSSVQFQSVPQNIIAKAEHTAPSYPARTNVEANLAYNDADYYDTFLNGDYVLDLNEGKAPKSFSHFSPIPTHAHRDVHNHHTAPSNVFPTHPRNEQPNLRTEPSHLPSPSHGHLGADPSYANTGHYYDSPTNVQNINYQLGSPVAPAQRHSSRPAASVHLPAHPVSPPHIPAPVHVPSQRPQLRSKNEYTPLATVPVSNIDPTYQQAFASNGIAIPARQGNLKTTSSVYEEVSLPNIETKGHFEHFGHNEHHDTSHHHQDHHSDEDHYLDKILKIAEGELGNEYEVLEDKHNPHKARKGYKQTDLRKEHISHRQESNSGYLPSPTQQKTNSKIADNIYRNPTLHQNSYEHHEIQLEHEDPYYEVPESKAAFQEVEHPSLIDSNDKYRNPALHHHQKDPYYEVPQPKLSHKNIPQEVQQDKYYVKDSEQKYRDPSSQYDGYELEKLHKSTESPYYDADVTDIEEESRHIHSINDDYDYNNLKSEDRYFNVPLASDGYGGAEISLIGVSDVGKHEKQHVPHKKHHDKYEGHEVYTVTDLKKTNVGSGRTLNGEGFATKDGFYYTRTEDYNPSEASKDSALQNFESYSRPGQYTEEVIKPIVVPDNPFEQLSKLISSANSKNEDEGPAFEYPEVIQGQGQYKDNVERHLNGLKDDHISHSSKSHQNGKSYKSKSSTKHYNDHPSGKVYSFGKSMSTIPFSYHKKDDYRQNEPSVLEQLARGHVNDGHPIRLSDSGSVSAQQRPNAYVESVQQRPNAYLESVSHPSQLNEERERFPFIAAIEHPSSDDFKDHNNKYSLKANKSKAIKRRRKVVKQRRRGGYGGRRRTARKADSGDGLPFTPRERQQYIKETIERKRQHEQVERRKRFTTKDGKEHVAAPLKENVIYHSPKSYSYSSFHLGSSS